MDATGLFLAKNAPHPHAALLFVEWVLSEEAQSFLATTLGKGSAMKGVRSKFKEFELQPDFVVTSWGAFVVPTRTPRPMIDKLNAAIKDIAAEPAVKARFLQAGSRTLSSTPEAALAFANKEREIWREVVRISGAKAE